MPAESIDRAIFENFYAGKVPWDIGKPRRPFVVAADQVTSPVLDAGCGTGEHALFFAARGHQVTGIDFVGEAIRRARRKAAQGEIIINPQVLVNQQVAVQDILRICIR
jgi:2-polyprenyl-3-methyl-5-hydroxy-6-metoxy-1,4-benzoquinol methylase